MKIYILEDDIVLCTELSKFLSSYNYTCEFSTDFENSINLALDSNADLILLDINLPYVDGYHICREIRKASSVAIIVMTSRQTDMDELMSLNLGADDFVTKPYNMHILLARISALLKRSKTSNYSEKIGYKGVNVIPTKSTVSHGANETELTKNELQILTVLIQNAGKIVSRNKLMNELWQSDEFINDNTLTVNVNRLRHKLDEIGAHNYIKTRRKQGYIV